MSETSLFRTQEQELSKLVEEFKQARIAVQDASRKLTQIESRIRRTFPSISWEQSKRPAMLSPESEKSEKVELSYEEALNYFDEMVKLAKNNGLSAVEEKLESFDVSFLNELRKHLGLSLDKSKPSRVRLIRLIVGRINQSVQLTVHADRRQLINAID